MKIASIILMLIIALASANERGKIDMHGGKSQSYGGFSKNFKDVNSTNMKFE